MLQVNTKISVDGSNTPGYSRFYLNSNFFVATTLTPKAEVDRSHC